MLGSIPHKRGAARIYSRNLTKGSAEICASNVIRLLDEDDKQIQREIGRVFLSMNSEHFYSLRLFIDAYASKTRLLENHFTEFMLKNGRLVPKWTLGTIVSLLDNKFWQGQSSWKFGVEDLIRLVLGIYNDPTTTAEIKNQTMNLFDQLMKHYTGEAYKVLAEWDSR